MRTVPIRYVRDMDEARRFYEALGLTLDFAGRPPRKGGTRWMEMGGSGGMLALHHAPPDHSAEVELSFESDEPLEDVVARLHRAGYEPATAIVDQTFGRSFTIRDPEGLLIQVNEHDRELHG